MPNKLEHENSPYLLQHSNNPVDWYPWGEEALNRARNENKPIFLSIGYAACHWCHVMEHESFEDPATAAIMNDNFINIKVDREERPDLDSIYMAATVAMTGSGGWPMSVFLTPDLRPFYTGTYFPPEPRFNMPAFRDLLKGIAQAWIDQREEISRVGEQVTDHILKSNNFSGSRPVAISPATLDTATANLLKTYDWGFGGWGDAPKFPQPMSIEFLLCQLATARPDSAEIHQVKEKVTDMVTHALKAMARGGMYDVIGGGFARYSVDNQWKTPHFEKMLYDNAQLALCYLHAFLLTGESVFREVCEATLDFLKREMTDPEGGFYSSLDADSEGQEGKYYVWNYAEIQSVLGKDIDFFSKAYGISNSHRAPGQDQEIILQRALDDQTLAARFNLSIEETKTLLSACHTRLFQQRSTRIRPGTDDKVLTGWNAMALTAFAEAGRYLARADYLEVAQQNARFLLGKLKIDGRLLRSWRNGKPRHQAYLEDYASLILGLLALYQSVPDQECYDNALRLADEMLAHFTDPAGGFFDIADDHEILLMKPKDIQDNATPSGNALAAIAMLQFVEYGDRPEWRKKVDQTLSAVIEPAVQYPTAFAKWLYAASLANTPFTQVAVIGNPDKAETKALLNVLWEKYRPFQVIAVSKEPVIGASPAILNERPMLNGQPTAYYCQGFVCQQPVNLPLELAAQLKRN